MNISFPRVRIEPPTIRLQSHICAPEPQLASENKKVFKNTFSFSSGFSKISLFGHLSSSSRVYQSIHLNSFILWLLGYRFAFLGRTHVISIHIHRYLKSIYSFKFSFIKTYELTCKKRFSSVLYIYVYSFFLIYFLLKS